MGKLKGKIAIITGASSGIGKASAQLFAREGAKVVVADIKEKEGQDLAKEIDGLFIKTDVSKPENLKHLILETAKKLGRVDIIFNNAGVYHPAKLEKAAPEIIERTLKVNLESVIWGSKYALEQMLKQKSGVILSTSSALGLVGEAESSVYCATKAGIINFTKALALETATKNIRVNCICPGPIETDLLYQGFDLKEEVETYRQYNPTKRFGKPEEVATVALFLASDDASYVTGAAFAVDGGESAK